MWDYPSIHNELSKIGFTEIRRCKFNDSEEEMFKLVEDKSRFLEFMASENKYYEALAIECRKPCVALIN